MSGVSTGIAMDDGQPLSILQFSPAAGQNSPPKNVHLE